MIWSFRLELLSSSEDYGEQFFKFPLLYSSQLLPDITCEVSLILCNVRKLSQMIRYVRKISRLFPAVNMCNLVMNDIIKYDTAKTTSLADKDIDR